MNSFTRLYDENREAIWIITAFTVLRMAVAPTFGLGTDEAHYVLYARFLDLSYFDHPPLVGWTHALFYYTLGTNEFLARLPAILLFIVTSFLCYRLVRSVSAKRPALLAIVALNSSFLLSGLGLMLLPESLLLPITFALIFTVLRLEYSPSIKNFIFLGLILGLAGLAKYTSILFVPAILIYGLIKKRYDILLNPRILISAIVALVIILPVIYWNVHTDFISFRYQSSHVVGGHMPNFAKFFQGLGAQFGAYSPPFFCLAFYGLYQAFKSRSDALLLAAVIGSTILLFFLYSSLFKFALPHWSAVFYALFIPLGVAFLDQSPIRMKRGILVFSIGFSIIVILLLQSELAVKAFRFPDYKSPFRDIYGIPDVVKRANEILAQDNAPRKALAVTNWTYVSRMMYYNIPYKSGVFLLGNDDERFTTWYSGSPFGADILFITNHFERPDIGREMKCSAVSDAGQMDILLHGGKVDTIDYVWCRSFGGISTSK
jgi:hypothetical protein